MIIQNNAQKDQYCFVRRQELHLWQSRIRMKVSTQRKDAWKHLE